MKIDFTVENDNKGDFLIKFYCDEWELNIWLIKEETELLKNLKNANWMRRNSIKAGHSANASIFWAYENNDKTVSILVGNDPETWDFAVSIQLETINKMLDEIL
jgi:hypothetical protein